MLKTQIKQRQAKYKNISVYRAVVEIVLKLPYGNLITESTVNNIVQKTNLVTIRVGGIARIIVCPWMMNTRLSAINSSNLDEFVKGLEIYESKNNI